MKPKAAQRGVILIIVLWFITILTVIAATLASEVRLSAKAVFHNRNDLQHWGETLSALNRAEMELLLSKMPEPVNNPVPLEKRKNPAYRFNGQELTLAYAAPNSTISTRIYDEAGKINLLYLTKIQMQQLLEKRMGKDKERLEALDDAWQDWIDTDDTKRLNGAEKEYYEKLDPPYEPRNEKIQTIGELLMIKGFKEAFKGVELDTVFTIYGSTAGVNPNLATREVLLMLPGMTDEIANIILTQRREKEFRTVQDFNEFMQPEQLAEFAPWVHFAASNFYTIALYPKDEAELKALEEKQNSGDKTSTVEKKPEPELDKDGKPKEEKIQFKNRQAYMVTVQIQGSNQAPKVLMTNPYGTLPDMRHETMPIIETKNTIRSSSGSSLPSTSGSNSSSSSSGFGSFPSSGSSGSSTGSSPFGSPSGAPASGGNPFTGGK